MIGALLGILAHEIHLCGDDSALPVIKRLIEQTGDELDVPYSFITNYSHKWFVTCGLFRMSVVVDFWVISTFSWVKFNFEMIPILQKFLNSENYYCWFPWNNLHRFCYENHPVHEITQNKFISNQMIDGWNTEMINV